MFYKSFFLFSHKSHVGGICLKFCRDFANARELIVRQLIVATKKKKIDRLRYNVVSHCRQKGALSSVGSTISQREGANLLFGQFFPENCMKMKTFLGQRGRPRVPRAPPPPPQDAPMLRLSQQNARTNYHKNQSKVVCI